TPIQSHHIATGLEQGQLVLAFRAVETVGVQFGLERWGEFAVQIPVEEMMCVSTGDHDAVSRSASTCDQSFTKPDRDSRRRARARWRWLLAVAIGISRVCAISSQLNPSR